MKTFPFLNWLGRKTLNLDLKLSHDIDTLLKVEHEFDEHMLAFESILVSKGLYSEYLELRKHALEVLRERNRVGFDRDFINLGLRK